MSTTPVVHLELRISPRIFEKIRFVHNGIHRGLGENDSRKKPKSKARGTVPLNNRYYDKMKFVFEKTMFHEGFAYCVLCECVVHFTNKN